MASYLLRQWVHLLAIVFSGKAQARGASPSGSSGCGRDVPVGVQPGRTTQLSREFTGTVGTRKWLLHLPASYDANTPIPLLIALHGWHGSPSEYEARSGLSILSESEHYVVAYPFGMDDHPGAATTLWTSWNVVGASLGVGPDGPTCEAWADPDADFCYNSCQPCTQKPRCQWTSCTNDITPTGVGKENVTGFLPQLYSLLEEEFCIDLHREYATGFSNGGMATYQLGSSMTERLAAIVPVAGSFMRGFVQAPTAPLPVMDVHGASDVSVPSNGTLSADGYYYAGTEEILSAWRNANWCDGRQQIDARLEHWETEVDGALALHCISEGVGCIAPVVRCVWAGPHDQFGGGVDKGLLNAKLVWGFLARFSRERLARPASVANSIAKPTAMERTAAEVMAESQEQRKDEETPQLRRRDLPIRRGKEDMQPSQGSEQHGLRSQTQGLGPGAGPWQSVAAESHGLDTGKLEAASKSLMESVPERYCVLVVKNGEIVHETYAAGTNAHTTYEIDSVGKTLTSLIIGAAVEAGVIDIDVPLQQYGLEPQCDSDVPDCWRVLSCPEGYTCPNGSLGFYPIITARHILSHASGCVTGEGCTAPPGTSMSYDSSMYLAHLSALIAKRTNMSALEWANAFVSDLGIPNIFANDELDDTFAVGGGQLATCRDMARIGQLMINKGLWLGRDGKEKRMVAAHYIQEMLTPQFLQRGYTYSLLCWVNGRRPSDARTPCCGGRWGNSPACRQLWLNRTLLSDDIMSDVNETVGIAMGRLGRYVYILPERNVTFVTMGTTWGATVQCPAGPTHKFDAPYAGGYDDSFIAGMVWHLMDDAMRVGRSGATSLGRSSKKEASLVIGAADLKNIIEDSNMTRGATANLAHLSEPSQAQARRTHVGSCSCSCPPGRGFGYCYDLPQGMEDCSSHILLAKAADDCPTAGALLQCDSSGSNALASDCAAAGEAIRGDFGAGTERLWGGHMSCSVARSCSSVAGEDISVSTCSCKSQLYGTSGCSYSKYACKDNLDAYTALGSPLPLDNLTSQRRAALGAVSEAFMGTAHVASGVAAAAVPGARPGIAGQFGQVHDSGHEKPHSEAQDGKSGWLSPALTLGTLVGCTIGFSIAALGVQMVSRLSPRRHLSSVYEPMLQTRAQLADRRH